VSTINEHPGVLQYSRIRRSPYFYASRRHGVQLYSFYNHMYHPRHYGDPVEEYWHLLNGVTLWDVGVERQVEITGPDAFTFTNMLVPRDLNKCEVGQCKYVFVTSHEGGILNDPVLLRLEENRFWLSLADSDVLLWAWGIAQNSGLDVQISEPDVGPVQVQGPKSKDVMVDLFGEDLVDIPYYFMREYELDGMNVVVSRTGYTGELGYEIYLNNASRDGVKLWDAVLEAGKPHDLQVIGPCHIKRIEAGILALGCDMWFDTNPYEVEMGYEWMVDLDQEADFIGKEALKRIEAGILALGCDMWFDTNPYEVEMGYEWMVDLDQEADFIGKEALKRIKADGVSRKLVGVEIGGPGLGSYNDGSMIDYFPVFKDGKEVGEVTSACYSPRLEKNIGYAMLPIALTEFGTELEVETPSGRQSAVVVRKPFIDPKKDTPKQEVAIGAAAEASNVG
jgi:glycine cleavage system aminomethyltransferase T